MLPGFEYERPLALDDASMALAELAQDTLDEPVPSCPGWRMADLVWHVFWGQYVWEQVIALDLAGPGDVPPLERPPDHRLVAGFRAHAQRYATVLQAGDPDSAIIRRLVPETEVHLWDACSALGVTHQIEPEQGVDGVTTVLECYAHLGEPLTLAADGVVWRTRADGGVEAAEEEPPADAVTAPSASDLLLTLYRREPAHTLSDERAAQRLLGSLRRLDPGTPPMP